MSWSFVCTTPLAIGDDVVGNFAGMTFTNGALAGAVTAGCGTSTFTAVGANSGASATITFTVATAALPADTPCTITLPTGLTTVATAVAASAPGAVPKTPQIKVAALTGVKFTAGATMTTLQQAGLNPLVTVPTSTVVIVIFAFTNPVDLAVGDALAVKLPGWAFGSSLTIAGQVRIGCGTSTFNPTHTGSATTGAVVTFTVATATLKAGANCQILQHGFMTAASPQATQ